MTTEPKKSEVIENAMLYIMHECKHIIYDCEDDFYNCVTFGIPNIHDSVKSTDCKFKHLHDEISKKNIKISFHDKEMNLLIQDIIDYKYKNNYLVKDYDIFERLDKNVKPVIDKIVVYWEQKVSGKIIRLYDHNGFNVFFKRVDKLDLTSIEKVEKEFGNLANFSNVKKFKNESEEDKEMFESSKCLIF